MGTSQVNKENGKGTIEVPAPVTKVKTSLAQVTLLDGTTLDYHVEVSSEFSIGSLEVSERG